MAAASPLPPSASRPIAKSKLKRGASDLIDPLFYNHLLDELRQHQDAGTAYYGSFLYEPQPVPASLLLPSGTPIFQSEDHTSLPQAGKNAAVFERVASAKVNKDSAGVKLLTEPPESVRSRVLSQSPAGRPLQRAGSGFRSPPVTGKPSDLKPAVEAVTFIEKAKSHYGGSSAGGWKEQLSAQLIQRAAQWEHVDLQSMPFSEEEAMLVLVGRYILGNCWTDVAKFLPGRTGKMVKSFWHSKLRPRYYKYGWKGRELSPPPELHKSAQIRPGSAAGEGLKGGAGDTGGDDSEDDEPREEVEEETNEEALAREHALMQAALAARDPAAVLRAYHLQYERLLAAIEEQAAARKDWEERCFLCKDGGDLLCCQEGHREGGAPCWKAYHVACLGTRAPTSEDSFWCCPRHACASDRCSEPVQSECATCSNSYCEQHRQGHLDPQSPDKAGGMQRIVCDRCRALRGDNQSEAGGRGAASESPTAASERKRRQRQRERDEAKRVEMERQRERRERDRRKREEDAEREHADDADSPEWVRMLSSIKHMPTNNGGPIVSRIEKATALARGRVHPEVIAQLQLAVSAAVYKSNAAGNTRNQALAAIDLHRTHERCEKGTLDDIADDPDAS
ncbi:hypothetical protein KFL_001180210 [Klebsormidium nitens]|uniref:Uncharacterized protein n=1 Tax=Klebsormidium nitens TaxID=105231 RepID=A0A1Y1HY11_KLENI|nr:hypothetical protein KFL_001180210 [Klebsormidium nitens]|eukprot:GAQ82642.1 hypothetical protein KFL_001180210 [Klebsormidium nitens]